MADDSAAPEGVTDDLVSFEKDFFNPSEEDVDPIVTNDDEAESGEDEDEIGENPPATDEDEDEEDSDADEEDSDEDSEEEEEPKPRKKPPVQTRIDELTARAREAERREQALMERLRAVETREQVETPPAAVERTFDPQAPSPDAVNENGQALYPLGEFDPAFISDLTQFNIDTKMAAMQARQAQEAEARAVQEAQQALAQSWSDKLAEAEEDIPTIRDDLGDLMGAFTGIDPNYGDFLAMTLMQSDAGPELTHYLSQNIDEARQIVAAGPSGALRAIGRLEARLQRVNDSNKRNSNKVSAAPPPPVRSSKGRGANQKVRGDTDNQDDFEKAFF